MNRFVRVLASLSLMIIGSFYGYQASAEVLINNVDVNAARNLMLQNETVVVLDVRTPNEYAMEHIEGAINISIADMEFSESVSKLDHGRTYIVYCTLNKENGRTDKSLKIMSGLGFKKLYNMKGGIFAWKQNGYPIVQSELQEGS